MLSTDKRARAVCEAMAQHEGVAWVGMVLRGRQGKGPGHIVGYAAVRRVGSLGHDGGFGWWCVYIGMWPEFAGALEGLALVVHGGATWPWPRLAPFEPLPEGLEGLAWTGWDYAHGGDSIRKGDGLRQWPLEVVVEQELKGAVAQLDMGEDYPARGIAGRVVRPEEWVYGR